MSEYYVYAHYLSGSNLPFYIGKGKDNRAWVTQYRNFLWNEVTKENSYEVKIIQDNMAELSALELETRLVEQYGRIDIGTGILVNMTDGGNGGMGTVFTEELRKRFSDAAKERWNSDHYRKLQSVSQLESWKNEKIRTNRVSRMNVPSVRIKHSNSKKKLWKDKEYKEKVINKHKENWCDLEYRETRISQLRDGYNRRLANVGYVPCSEETKIKISSALKNKEKLTCPTCGKVGGSGAMKRWHFENCKY